jgi:hypothetical protein
MQNKFFRNDLVILSIVIVITFILKLLLLVDFRNLPLLGDDYLYWTRSLDTLRYYFTSLDLQAPLYEIFIALNKILFQVHALTMVKIEQLILQSIEIYFIYFLAARFFSKRVALCSGIIAGVYPELVSYGYLLFSETFYLFLFLPGLILYFRSLRDEESAGAFSMAASGFLNGLASLVRSVNFYFFPLLLTHYWIFAKGSRRGKIKATAAFLMLMAATVSMQTVKNIRIANCFILIDTSAPRNFYRSHNVSYPMNMDFRGNNTLSVDRTPCPEQDVCAATRCESANSFKFIAGHPIIFIKHAVIKTVNLYSPNLIIYKNIFKAEPAAFPRAGFYQGRWLRLLGSLSYLLLMLLALLGFFLSREWVFKSYAVLWVLYLTSLCAFFLGASRYRMPFAPLLIIFAGSFLGMRREDFSEIKSWKIILPVLLWLILIVAVWNRLLLILS